MKYVDDGACEGGEEFLAAEKSTHSPSRKFIFYDTEKKILLMAIYKKILLQFKKSCYAQLS